MNAKRSDWQPTRNTQDSDLRLENGSRVAIVGGGPAGSLFGYFALEIAKVADLELQIDLFEPRDFSKPSPAGCNMCGGIISESLVQNLAAEGITLPGSVIQRGIDSYVLHSDVGSVHIATPTHERRIGAVHRGAGPRDAKVGKWSSFDHHLQQMAIARGVRWRQARVAEIGWSDGRPEVTIKGGSPEVYDLLVGAVGVNSSALKLFEGLGVDYVSPRTTKTFIREYHLGEDVISETLGPSMHVFLLNIPRLEFAAIIPKGDFITICIIGEDIDQELVANFLSYPIVTACLPPGWDMEARSCQCLPKIAIRGATHPYADRLVFIGDCGVTRLYKDGIGAAYRTAKAAANTVIYKGISERAFSESYGPVCRAIVSDNSIGRLSFFATGQLRKYRFARRAMVNMAAREQLDERSKRMSRVLWDMFSGSAPYRDIFLSMLHPAFLGRLGFSLAHSLVTSHNRAQPGESKMAKGNLGRVYQDGEVIVRQGEPGNCMYVIQEGKAKVYAESEGREVLLAVCEVGDLIGEMAIFESQPRSATVRAAGRARLLTVDKKNFLRRIQEDPSLAVRIIQTMSHRVRDLSEQVAMLRAEGGPSPATAQAED